MSEKIQYLKLYGNTPKKTLLADKILVKEYIKNKVPELKYAKIYQQGKSFKEIDLNQLPQKFVLKTNHSWKTNIIIENKSELTKEELKIIEKFYKKMLKINYAYWAYYELHYKDIKPLVFAEEFAGYRKSCYEVWCFNGRIEFIVYKYIIDEVECRQYFFDNKWKQQDFYMDFKNHEEAEPPKNKEKVIEYSQKLCKDIDFVRIDYMEINNELYFGEMTFTPCSGFFKFVPDKFDLIYGRKLKI